MLANFYLESTPVTVKFQSDVSEQSWEEMLTIGSIGSPESWAPSKLHWYLLFLPIEIIYIIFSLLHLSTQILKLAIGI